jgi:hypothetical protein
MIRRLIPALPLLVMVAMATCDSPSDPDNPPDPGPGPHFTVVPIELDKLARVTPLGTNGKILPLGHTYWYTCDTEYLLPVDRPCVRERLPIRAPTSGRVFAVEHVADGGITIEGPPGLYAGFAHVTPKTGLRRGDRVQAGDTIAVMYTDFAFDFGLTNYGIQDHTFINQARYNQLQHYIHAQSPVAQYAEPVRSQLIQRVNTQGDPLGRLVFDVAGTASGNWFLEGTPLNQTFTPAYAHAQMYLGPLQERPDISILSNEAGWFTSLLDIGIVDPAAPAWQQITPASGRVWLRLWQVTRDAGPDYDAPRGGVLVEVLPDERLRIEYFPTHSTQTAFTSAARLYER